MTTVNQPTFRPTNKLTAAMIAGASYEFAQPVVAKGVDIAANWSGIDWALNAQTDMLLQFGLMAAVGYMVKDKPNV